MAKLEAKTYTLSGKEKGSVTLSESVFGLSWNNDLVHQVLVGMESNARRGTAHSKDRSEVSGGGKKPWRQKGTGQARHGSRRSPIWVGGGVTFGPRNERNYDKKINKKMKTKALFIGLSQKLRDNEMLFVEPIAIDTISTKEANKVFTALETVPGFETLNTKKSNNALLVIPTHNETVKKSAKNLEHVTVVEAEKLNIVDLAKYRYIVIASPEESIATWTAKVEK